MKISITSVGSRGDVQPYIDLAEILAEEGIEVTLLLDEGFVELVPSHPKLKTARFGRYTKNDLEKVTNRSLSAPTPDDRGRSAYYEFVERRKDELADRIVYVSDREEVDLAIVSSSLGSVTNGLEAIGIKRALMIHTFCKQTELEQLDRTNDLKIMTTGLFLNRSYASKPKWCVTDPLHWKSDQICGAAKIRKLFVTFGSMDPRLFERIVHVIAEAAAEINLEIDLQCKHKYRDRFQRYPNVNCMADQIDYDKVFPEAMGLICHGGSGTVLSGLRHGLPIAVVPTVTDQVDWAQWLQQKTGLASCIDAKSFNKSQMIQLFEDMVSQEVQDKMNQLSEAITRSPDRQKIVDRISEFCSTT